MSEAHLGQSSVGRSSEVILMQDVEPETQAPTDNETSTESSNITPNNIRDRANRHLNSVARHFNILDRVFQRHSSAQARLQYGASSDGVFSNLSAKPENNSNEVNGESDKPPTYDEAAADMAPSYYGIDDDGVGLYYNEICIEGLPVGNIVNFLWNMIVSVSFQFVGFLLTYILHTSHAAKEGSRFGLGLTFIGYAYSMIPNDVTSKIGKGNSLDRVEPTDPNEFDDMHLYSGSTSQDEFESSLSHGLDEKRSNTPVLAVVLGILGVVIMIKSIYGYIKVKKMERRYLTQEQV